MTASSPAQPARPARSARPAPPARPVQQRARARSFNSAAAQYAANRPSYPPALLDTIEEEAGRPLAGARTVDVGAGTGIATALLRARDADVVAVEPGDGMAAEFRRRLPDVPLVRGDGDALPFADASADLVTYAQSWHWTRPDRSVPEALRVLRPGGALALWWNMDALDVPWIAAQERRLKEFFGADSPGKKGSGGIPAEAAFAAVPGVPPHSSHRIRWSRTVPVDTHLANISSHSIFLMRGAEGCAAFLAAERDHLLDAFPDGHVEEVYDVLLLLTRRS
ncbi:class I SAM-dependent methyltransferase [Streptomyces minutiscleroticus]|uniref:Methyltransferase n=1 Tax=Streptomyces minutiscleroticus TaxID=68238 RepID=A0A918U699_9ACTN|nr:class I SAM-dependent methyltransferase [Streptomyces minutiscleroticus]GGX98500.1 methyltransferase [Streptomyces minutiscleroticus]